MLNKFKMMFRRGEVGCGEVRRLSSDYLEEDLNHTKQSAIQSHLSWCAPCQKFVDTLSSTVRVLSRLPRISAPSSFKQSILEQTTRKKEDQSS